ncbi:hypothetical protein GIB67_040594 [Kingdonia uniflora]|uniref:Uncharacterized protein n=1 Tax=Kingdonia uniflora TaxID=39325 RepID=A0A7J7M8U8_9MAGN|nr:hypothetical protein GIB67_040594 [Kingdonia uniflora]
MAIASSALSITGGSHLKSSELWSTKLSTLGQPSSLTFRRKSQQSGSNRNLSVCAEYNEDSREGGGSDFVAGFLLGSIVFGAVGYIFAPQSKVKTPWNFFFSAIMGEEEYFRRLKLYHADDDWFLQFEPIDVPIRRIEEIEEWGCNDSFGSDEPISAIEEFLAFQQVKTDERKGEYDGKVNGYGKYRERICNRHILEATSSEFCSMGELMGHMVIRRSLLNENEHGFRKATRPIYYDEGLETTRQTLNAKISQLNSAIDKVSSRLRGGGKKATKDPIETESELEATM